MEKVSRYIVGIGVVILGVERGDANVDSRMWCMVGECLERTKDASRVDMGFSSG